MRRRRIAVAVLAGLVVLAAVGGAMVVGRRDAALPRSRPDVVVIMTDDQTLASMRFLPRTNRLLGARGTTFTDAVVSFPNCCPSRATFLTGQYAHNTGVLDNVAPAGGFAKLDSSETLPVWLQRSGYWTASIGKYLNGWGQDGAIQPPPGWNRWFGLIDPTTYSYFGFQASDQGRRVRFANRPQDYSTDVVARTAVSAIERAPSGKPLFMQVTPLAPHVQTPERATNGKAILSTPVPAPRDKGTMAGVPLPRPPSFDEADTSDKSPQIARPRIGARDLAYLRRYWEAEIESLQAVDRLVESVVGALERSGRLDRSVVMFTSDNGLFHGEHRIRTAKFYLYEPAVRVPLVIRGGPFAAGRRIGAPVANVDLAPTILDLTGARPPASFTQDGRSLVGLVRDPGALARRGVLLENQYLLPDGSARRTVAIRTARWKLIVWDDGWEELYDLRADPDEVTSLARDPALARTKADLRARLETLRRCRGRSCEGWQALPSSGGRGG
ncbi:MAG: sulfatase [Actinobacteria bacterium]|nr:sulfatase [Actinomycetota bacterium]